MDNPQDFISVYERTLATQSWEKIAPLIHEDCVVTFSEGTYVGKAEVESAYRKTFSLIKDEEYAISNIHWVLETDKMAVLIYIFSWSGIIEGTFSSGSGRGTSVLTKHEGKWQLICEHLGALAK